MIPPIDLLRTELIAYLFRKQIYYENDVIELNNHTAYRNADPVDHLEMIMAQTRLATCEEICDNILEIIHLSYYREQQLSSDNYTK